MLSVSADAAVVEAVKIKSQDLKSGGTWWSAQAGAIEHEIEQAHRLHAQGVLTRAELDSVLKHMGSRLAAEKRKPDALAIPESADDWRLWTLDARREWLARFIDRIVVAKFLRATPGPKVALDRVTVHFKDGQLCNLDRPVVTMKQVAELAGCSMDHASRSLHGVGRFAPETQLRVRAAAAELGYVMSSRRRTYGSGQS